MEYLNQLIKDLHLVIRDNTLRAEFDILREHKFPVKDAIKKLSEKTFLDANKNPYKLTEKTIEGIIYKGRSSNA